MSRKVLPTRLGPLLPVWKVFGDGGLGLPLTGTIGPVVKILTSKEPYCGQHLLSLPEAPSDLSAG